MNMQYTEALITRHEQYRARVYPDTKGYLTVGVGYRMDQPGGEKDFQSIGADFVTVREGKATLTNAQIDHLFSLALERTCVYCRKLVVNFEALPDVAQAVLADMVYNVGPAKFAQFTKMIAAFEKMDYLAAAYEMQNSAWYAEVKTRAVEDVALIRSLIPRRDVYAQA